MRDVHFPIIEKLGGSYAVSKKINDFIAKEMPDAKPVSYRGIRMWHHPDRLSIPGHAQIILMEIAALEKMQTSPEDFKPSN